MHEFIIHPGMCKNDQNWICVRMYGDANNLVELREGAEMSINTW